MFGQQKPENRGVDLTLVRLGRSQLKTVNEGIFKFLLSVRAEYREEYIRDLMQATRVSLGTREEVIYAYNFGSW